MSVSAATSWCVPFLAMIPVAVSGFVKLGAPDLAVAATVSLCALLSLVLLFLYERAFVRAGQLPPLS